MSTAHSVQQTPACRRCGECCRIRGFVRVSDDEVNRIAELLRLSPRSFADRHTRLAHDRCGLELEEKENGECIFLDGAECAIHAVKPEQCKTFPRGWRYPGVEEICPDYAKASLGRPARLASDSVAVRQNTINGGKKI